MPANAPRATSAPRLESKATAVHPLPNPTTAALAQKCPPATVRAWFGCASPTIAPHNPGPSGAAQLADQLQIGKCRQRRNVHRFAAVHHVGEVLELDGETVAFGIVTSLFTPS